MNPAISPSRAADFKQCPLKYRLRTIDRLEETPSPAAVRGTLVHAVLEEIFELPPAERTPEAARALVPGRWAALDEVDDALAALVEEHPELAEMVAGEAELTEERWFAQAGKLTDRWFTLEDPSRLEPAEREVQVEVEIDGLTHRMRTAAAAPMAMVMRDPPITELPSGTFFMSACSTRVAPTWKTTSAMSSRRA